MALSATQTINSRHLAIGGQFGGVLCACRVYIVCTTTNRVHFGCTTCAIGVHFGGILVSLCYEGVDSLEDVSYRIFPSKNSCLTPEQFFHQSSSIAGKTFDKPRLGTRCVTRASLRIGERTDQEHGARTDTAHPFLIKHTVQQVSDEDLQPRVR